MEFDLLLKSHSDERARELLQSRYSLSGTQKPFLVLHDVKPAPKPDNKRTKRKSSNNKQLAKFLKKGTPKYETYTPINYLWSQYIETNFKSSGDYAQTILSADWHGAIIEVTAANNATQVGLKGILLWEAKNQILIVTERNQFKQIPKQGTIFNMHFRDKTFAIVGDRVCCRNYERTSRKFKPHRVSKLTHLLQSYI